MIGLSKNKMPAYHPREVDPREQSPAAQLAAVSSHYLGLFIRYFVSKAKRTVFESMIC